MAALPLIITDVGRAALVNADNLGLLPIAITEVGIGTEQWTPDETATALQAEIKRLNTVGGLAISDDTIHVSITDDTADVYTFSELGLYTGGGVLFAIYSQATLISTKATESRMMLSADVQFLGVPAGSVTVNGAGFSNPPATTTLQGVVELATDAEAQAKTDSGRVLTPKNLAALLATSSFAGLIELASNAEAQAKSATTRALTPANLAALAATTAFRGLVELTNRAEAYALTDTGRALTPDALKYVLDNRNATTTLKGTIELATNTEGNAGTDTTRAITAATLKHVLDNRNASTTVTGLVELATNTEAKAKSAANRALTPANLAALAATTAFRGLVELTSRAEAYALTDTGRALTPDALKYVLDNRNATTTLKGTIELATNTEGNAGTDTTRAITAAALKHVLDNRNASTTVTGLIELATNAEAEAKSATNRALTPANLAALAATTAFRGLVELATSAEANAGTDTVRALTPVALKYVLDNRNATTTLRGLIELATSAEANAGTDTARAVTPSGVQSHAENWSPVGMIATWALSSVPGGFLECNGATISRITYARLFAVIGTYYGAGDGSTTFQIPDYRGEFLRGRDGGRGADPDAASRTGGDSVGSTQPGQFERHYHGDLYGALDSPLSGVTVYNNPHRYVTVEFPATDGGGGNETRPRNIAVMFVIKY